MNNFTPPDEFISLYSLDALQENDFDFILDIASNLFESTVACISFFGGNRLWYKSNELHLPQDFTLNSFWTKVEFPVSDGVFEMNNIEHQYFIQQGVRSITGIALTLSDKRIIGHLSIWHRQKNEFTEKESKFLSILAKKIVSSVEQNKVNFDELRFEKKQLLALLDSTNGFIWSIDKNLNLISANKSYIDTIKKITGKSLKVGESFLLEGFYSEELIVFFKEQCQKAFLGSSFSIDTFMPATEWYNAQWMDISFNPIYEKGEINGLVINARNITKRKKDKERIRKSKEQYELLFLSNPQPMWIYEQGTLKFLEINQAAIQHYGYSKEEFQNLTLLDILHPDDTEQMLAESSLNTLLRTNKFEWRHIKKNGDIICVQVSSHGIKYQSKKARHVLINDITEQKKHVLLLEEGRANTLALINSTDDLVWSVDQNNKLLIANDLYINFIEKVSGVSLKPGDDNMVEGFQKDVSDYWKGLMKRVLGGESFITETYNPELSDISGAWNETRFNPIIEGGKVLGAAMFARNITNRKEIELAFETNQRILLETSEVARVGGWEVDLVNKTVSWSKITKEIHEIPLDYQPSYDETILFYRKGETRNRIRSLIDDVVDNAKEFDFEIQIITAKGNERWVRVKGGVKVLAGKPVRLYGMIQDLDDRKKSEILLKETSEIGRVGGWQYDLISRRVTWDSITKAIHEESPDYEPDFNSSMQSYKEGKSRDAILQAVYKAIKDGTPYDLEVQIVTKKGKERWVRAKARVEFAGEKPIRIFGMIQDINDQKKHLEEIEMQNKQLREIAWMQSHIVRAPVARIMGIVNLFQDYDDLEISTNELFHNISDSAYEIDDIIRKINNTIQTNHNHVIK